MYKLQILYQDFGAAALFRRLVQKLGNPLPVTEDMAGRLERSVQQNFDAQGRPDPWAKLNSSSKVAWHTSRMTFWNKKGSKMTKKGREAWSNRKVLTATGRLRRSVVGRAFPNRVEVGTRVKYALFHQEGTRKMPARPFLLVQAEDWRYFVERWNRWLMEA